MNIIVNNSKVVHQVAAHEGTVCGAEYRKGRYGTGRSNVIHFTEAEATCKTCIKRTAVAASTQEVVAQAVETLKEAAAEAPVMYRRTCACCQERIRGTREEIAAHSQACWTAYKAR